MMLQRYESQRTQWKATETIRNQTEKGEISQVRWANSWKSNSPQGVRYRTTLLTKQKREEVTFPTGYRRPRDNVRRPEL